MEILPRIVSEYGSNLIYPNEGIILQGNIYGAKVDEDGIPDGEPLTSDNFPDLNETPEFCMYQINCQAFSWQELISVLKIPTEELQKAVEDRKIVKDGMKF